MKMTNKDNLKNIIRLALEKDYANFSKLVNEELKARINKEISKRKYEFLGEMFEKPKMDNAFDEGDGIDDEYDDEPYYDEEEYDDEESYCDCEDDEVCPVCEPGKVKMMEKCKSKKSKMNEEDEMDDETDDENSDMDDEEKDMEDDEEEMKEAIKARKRRRLRKHTPSDM